MLLLTFCCLPFSAQCDDYARQNLLYEDHIYTSNIKTVRFYFSGWETGFPAIRLNSDEKLIFGFDDFDNDYK